MRLRPLLALAALAAALPLAHRPAPAQPAKLGVEAPDPAPAREAIAGAQQRVRDARAKLSAAERELRYQRHRRRPRGEADTAIEAAEAELAAAEAELARAVEEGRRAGLLPGDLRDLGVD